MANIKISRLSGLTGDNLQDVDLLPIVDLDANNDGNTRDRVTKNITIGDLKTGIFASPTFTGTPLAPTATASTNNTQIATTEFVTTAIVANIFTLPEASASTLGGIKVGTNLSIDADGVLSASGSLAGLTDTTITSIGDGEIISYDNSSSKYVNKTLAEAGIAISASPTFTGNPQSNAAPTSGDHLANKTYVDTTAEGTSNFTTDDSQAAGYQVFASGLKMAWGNAAVTLGGTITFPSGVNFTVAPSVTANYNKGTNSGTYNAVAFKDVTTTNFVVVGTYGASYGARYLAIGH